MSVVDANRFLIPNDLPRQPPVNGQKAIGRKAARNDTPLHPPTDANTRSK